MRIFGLLCLFLMLNFFSGCSDDCAVCPELEVPDTGVCDYGKSWQVPQDFSTIAQALTVDEPGDTVLVAGGIYEEHDLHLGPGLVLLGAGTEDSPVIIDGQGLGQILRCVSGDTLSVLSGLTFTGGFIGDESYNNGAALKCSNAWLRVADCIFVDNHVLVVR